MSQRNAAHSAEPDDGRTPPMVIEAEEAVLGAMLIDPAAFDVVQRYLRASHFVRIAHQTVYRRILALHAAGSAVDYLTVSAALEAAGELDGIGGSAYLTELMTHTPVAYYVESYAELVRDAADERELITATGDIARIAWDGTDPRDARAKIRFAIARIGQLDETMTMREDGDIGGAFVRLESPRPDGWSTGIPRLDAWLGGAGVYPGRVYAVTGPTGVGKSRLLNNLTLATLRQNGHVCDFTLEMSVEERVVRLGAEIVGTDAFRLLRDPRKWTERDRANFDHIRGELEPYRSSGALRIFERQRDLASINAIVRVHEPDVALIDYYQNLARPEGARDKWEADERNAGLIEDAADKSRAAYVVASQLNVEGTRAARGGERGDATDMRFGQALAHKCDADLRLANVKDDAGGAPLLRIEPVKNRFGPAADQIAGTEGDNALLFTFDRVTGAIRPAFADADAAVPGLRIVQ